MSSFELNVSDHYTVQNVAENEWLNQKLTTTQYGIYYNVQFEGDAETYFLQAKTAPVVGDKLYGHIEQSKTGKSLRFKKDKLEEPQNAPYSPVTGYAETPDKQNSIYKSVALNNAAILYAQSEDKSNVLSKADEFLDWLTSDKPSESVTIEGTVGDVLAPTRPWNELHKAKDQQPDPEWDNLDIPEEWKGGQDEEQS